MIDLLAERKSWIHSRLDGLNPVEKVGRVVRVSGLLIESEGPDVAVGDICELKSGRKSESTMAEVVGFRDQTVLLMPLTDMGNIHPGCATVLAPGQNRIPVGNALLGRVIDGQGRPLDERGPLRCDFEDRILNASAPNPMSRQGIDKIFQTGVRSIDAFTPLGVGQRVGIFAGSGVGKSTLLGMIARGSAADVNVIALVGERGRELREFIEQDLGEEGMKKSVVVVSTSDHSAPLRLRAALLATSVAESFRDQGANVMLMMDSVTRFAMAQREVGLTVGEPPTSRGYTPSVFALLPRLLERAGNSDRGSITGIYTVLVEGDDMNEPVADAVRGILDGHIVLRRKLAAANHFPPVDVLDSVSRLTRRICSEEEQALMAEARDLLALYRENEDLIQVGAYTQGTQPRLDRAIQRHDPLMQFLKQHFDYLEARDDTIAQLKGALA
ncbi:MAG: FliI/YscN family ATPase [Opitutales bacterium]|nr:FliI/YscN family ATPase [Opitutales bacterium]NRA26883.1 FliI/YscN family ATPase [Opitutales bacterium]